MISRMNAEQSYALLRGGRVAHLGLVERGGPYVVPVNYVFDGEYFYFHTLPGRKVNAMRADPRVCVQVDEVRGDFCWKSVVAFGRAEELTGPDARAHALSMLLAIFPHLTPVESLIAGDAAAPRPLTFRIRLEHVTGLGEG